MCRSAPVAVLVVGAIYIGATIILHARGAGILAAYMAMPAWYVVGGLAYIVALALPARLLDATLFTWAGDLVLIVLSAGLNVACAYFLVRGFSK